MDLAGQHLKSFVKEFGQECETAKDRLREIITVTNARTSLIENPKGLLLLAPFVDSNLGDEVCWRRAEALKDT